MVFNSITVWINAFKAKVLSLLIQKTSSMKQNTKTSKCHTWVGGIKLALTPEPVFLDLKNIGIVESEATWETIVAAWSTMLPSLRLLNISCQDVQAVLYLPYQLSWLTWPLFHYLVAQLNTHYRDYVCLFLLSKHIVQGTQIWDIFPQKV